MAATWEHRDKRVEPGWTFEILGIPYRAVAGRKAERDVRLEWKPGERWAPVSILHACAHVAVIGENEDYLNPYPKRGGEMVLDLLKIARSQGYDVAAQRLAVDRTFAWLRRALGDDPGIAADGTEKW